MHFFKSKFLFILFALIKFTCSAQDIFILDNIDIHGNDVTKEKIILRELLFHVGDTINSSELDFLQEKSRENLLNTSLFNFVTITHKEMATDRINIHVDLQERWYIWPYPIFEHADRNLSSYLYNKEWSRLDYGLFVLINNFRGRKEILKLKTIFGYNQSYVVSYYNPFIDKNQKLGIGAELKYIRNKELAYIINDNELEYLQFEKDYARKAINLISFLSYRPYMYTNHILGLKYEKVNVSDTVVALNQNYFYTKNNSLEIISLEYNFDFDARDSKIYPLKGFRVYSSLTKKGIGIYTKEGPFFIQNILEENFQISKRFYLNTSIFGKYSFNNYNSFYFSEAIGFDNYLRGMEYYISNGMNYYISKSNFKFEIVPQTKIDINFLPTDKFSKAHYAMYINLFFDTGYVDSKNNIQTNISNEFLYSGGIGIDFVTYYDKVLRIEYSLNKFGEHGIFFHLGAPIID